MVDILRDTIMLLELNKALSILCTILCQALKYCILPIRKAGC